MTDTRKWDFGQIINRREILGFEPTNTVDPSSSWFGKSWLDLQARVVSDEPDELVIYIPPGSPMRFPEHEWPAEGGKHPWLGNTTGWQGEGCLMWHRPGEHHAVWHFYGEPDRSFQCWYVNVQTAYRRYGTTFETQDLELDFLIAPDHTWEVKDWDAVQWRVDEGRYSPDLGEWIHDYGRDLIAKLEQGDLWWPERWADWTPPTDWG